MELSIVIPAYNAAHVIRSTLEPVLPLAGDMAEILVIDDGSTDDLSLVLKPYIESSQLTLIRQQNSGGPASPRNRGIEAAKGAYIMFLDADDIVIAEQILPALEQLKKDPDASMICGNFDIVDSNLNTRIARNLNRFDSFQSILKEQVGESTWKIESNVAVSTLMQVNFVGTSSVIARRDCLEEVGGFDESLRNVDDRDMWIRLALSKPILYRSVVFYKYVDLPGSISKQHQIEQFRERVRVARKTFSAAPNVSIKWQAQLWMSRSELKIGHILFDEQRRSWQAFCAFLVSFSVHPNIAAFKGVVKSALPRRIYKWVGKV